jgi:NADH:ubiquinone oxidoreductase subunit 5 (subunit L)/multisubunit Na+/H+ antiporter MnhA subunit
LAFVSVAGIVVSLVQGLIATCFLLEHSPSSGFYNLIEFSWMTGVYFNLRFSIDLVACWAILVAATLALVTQVYSLRAVSRFAGRHLFHSLVLVLVGAVAFLATAQSSTAMLIGWEGIALAATFMLGFWALEQKETLAGIRWLLFQHASFLVLLLGTVLAEQNPGLAAVLWVSAACIRAGQVPFHGWIPSSASSSIAATVLVHGAASVLPAVLLLVRSMPEIIKVHYLPEAICVIGLAGVVLGVLASFQQLEPVKSLGWLFLFNGGLAFIGIGDNNPIASMAIVTGGGFIIYGLMLSIGSLTGSLGMDFVNKRVDARFARWAYLVLALGVVFPPAISFMGFGRLLGSVPDNTLGVIIRLAVCVCMVSVGWTLHRVYKTHSVVQESNGQLKGTLVVVLSIGLGLLVFVLGGLGFYLFDIEFAGGARGARWAGGVVASYCLGWGLGLVFSRRLRGYRHGRLTYTQRLRDRVASTGMGIGEFIVALPLMIVKALGVIFWRGIGDFVLDTVVFGAGVRLVEGIGIALRFIQNGRIQRYTFVVVLATLILILIMLR